MSDHSLRPPEIAREALRQLAAERLPPTPDNFRVLYHRIAGTHAEDPFPDRPLRAIAASLPRNTPERLKLAHQFENAIASGQWVQIKHAVIKLTSLEEAPHSVPPSARTVGATAASDGSPVVELLSAVIRRAIVPMLDDNETLRAEAESLAEAVKTLATAPHEIAEFQGRVARLTERIAWVEEDRRAIRQGLLNLLKLVLENIGHLVSDDTWLRGQLAMVSEVFAAPLDVRVLDEAERRLRDVIDKQTQLRQQLNDAQARLKSMLIGFMDHISGFGDSTEHYEATLTRCARDIQAADTLDDLTDAVGELLAETQDVRATARRSTEELQTLKTEVESANHHIIRLQRELDETSELVRHDPLTGVLNRKGLDEAIAREISMMQRRGSPLCVVLLDIDNFKQLNDTFGHRTGDEALQHLAQVIRDDLRPIDSVGRYGGEEFIVLLPDTTEEKGIEIVTRLQRALTKRFFLANNRRLLITFSAGLTRVLDDESPAEAIDRADRAMYAAKRAGKNRVYVAAE